jgi:mannosyl-oligosaccharide glucosidase
MSLFPMFLGLVPADSDMLGPILDLIENREELWTPHGLASLSQSDPGFGTGENYWRGPIWININYLVLRALHHNYMPVSGTHQDRAAKIYKRLRQNIVDTVYSEYERTGFVWEQYTVDGEGKRSHPFTGWTSLVLLIMAERY